VGEKTKGCVICHHMKEIRCGVKAKESVTNVAVKTKYEGIMHPREIRPSTNVPNQEQSIVKDLLRERESRPPQGQGDTRARPSDNTPIQGSGDRSSWLSTVMNSEESVSRKVYEYSGVPLENEDKYDYIRRQMGERYNLAMSYGSEREFFHNKGKGIENISKELIDAANEYQKHFATYDNYDRQRLNSVNKGIN
jgi:hypothetical protein